MSSGTAGRSSRSAAQAPIAIASDIARTPVGRSPSSQAGVIAAMPPSMLAGPTTTALVGGSRRPTAASAATIAAQPAAGHALGLDQGARRRRLDARSRARRDGRAAARCSAAARAPPSSSISTRRLVRQRRSSRPSPSAGRRARICSTSGWSAARPIATTPSTVARPIARGERPVQRRDEVERVPVLLGGQRDALAEGAEERVREDRPKRLRGQHADGRASGAGSASGRPGAADSPANPRRRGSGVAVSGASRSGLLNANETAVFDTPASAGDVGDARASRVRCLHASPRWLRAPARSTAAARSGLRVPSGRSVRSGLQNRFSKPV